MNILPGRESFFHVSCLGSYRASLGGPDEGDCEPTFPTPSSGNSKNFSHKHFTHTGLKTRGRPSLESRPEGIAHIRCKGFACGPPLPPAPGFRPSTAGRDANIACFPSFNGFGMLIPPWKIQILPPSRAQRTHGVWPGLRRHHPKGENPCRPQDVSLGFFFAWGRLMSIKVLGGPLKEKSRPFGRMFPCRGSEGKFRFGAKGSGNSLPAPLRRSPNPQDFLEASDVHFILMENRHLGTAAAQDIHGDLFSFFIEEG